MQFCMQRSDQKGYFPSMFLWRGIQISSRKGYDLVTKVESLFILLKI
jgi:hypothetical protein